MIRAIINNYDCLFVVVPEQASQFEFLNTDAKYFTYSNGSNGRQLIKLSTGTLSRWEHVGEITKDNINFDVEPFLEKIHVEIAPSAYNDFSGGFDFKYVDYLNRGEYAGWGGDAGCFTNKERSFRSLMHSLGLHFVNPYINVSKLNTVDEKISNYDLLLEQWQKAENNLLKDAKVEFLILSNKN